MIGNVLKQLGGAKLADKSTVYRDIMAAKEWSDGDSLPALPPVRGDRRTYLRVSSLSYLCPRLESFKIVNGIALRGSMDAESALTFMLGKHHHALMQDSLLPAILGPRMRGWWKFGKEEVAPYQSVGMPALMPKPDGRHWKYEEVYAFDDQHCVHGHPDMVIDWTGSGLPGVPDAQEVQEFKSKDQVSWAMIDPEQGGFPDKAHVIQTQAYMWLLGLDYGRIVYVKKGERRPDQTFVEWPIKRDPDIVAGIQGVVATFWDAVLAAHNEKKIFKDRLTACSKFESGRAGGCPLRYECHSRQWRKARTDIRLLTDEEKKAGGAA